MTGRKAVVPQLDTKMDEAALIPCTNVGAPTATKPRSKGPVCGAAAGRSRNVTPILRCGLAEASTVVIGRTYTMMRTAA